LAENTQEDAASEKRIVAARGSGRSDGTLLPFSPPPPSRRRLASCHLPLIEKGWICLCSVTTRPFFRFSVGCRQFPHSFRDDRFDMPPLANGFVSGKRVVRRTYLFHIFLEGENSSFFFPFLGKNTLSDGSNRLAPSLSRSLSFLFPRTRVRTFPHQVKRNSYVRNKFFVVIASSFLTSPFPPSLSMTPLSFR